MEILLYTRHGCHLCDDAKALLGALAAEYPHRLREVDIAADRDLMVRYGLTIPVLQMGGRELAAPIDEQRLRAFLAAAADLAYGVDDGHGQ